MKSEIFIKTAIIASLGIYIVFKIANAAEYAGHFLSK
jgi:hypothetical protein